MAVDRDEIRRQVREEFRAERLERERDERDAKRDADLASMRVEIDSLKKPKLDTGDGDDHEPEV